MLAGRQQEIHAERDRKLAEAQKRRQLRRQQGAWRGKSQVSEQLRVAGEIANFRL